MQIPKRQPEKALSRQEQIAERMAQIPESQQKGYLKAAHGKASPRSAIKAFCCECMGYERAEVTVCTDLACPLFLFRPFRTARPEQRMTAESMNGVGSVKQAADSNLAQQRAHGAAVSERTPAEAITQQAVDKFLSQEAQP